MRGISMFSFYTLIFLITNTDSIRQNYNQINVLLINCVVGLVASIIGAVTIEHKSIGRKKLLFITGLLSSLSLVLSFALQDYSWHIIGIFATNFFLTIQYLTVGLYINEAYRTKVRNTAGSLTFMISRFGSILGPFMVLVSENLITGVSLIIISCIQLLFMLLCAISPVETKNKSLDEQI
mmetsp:Transcript_33757/g.6107  ORF Transcript_33757/g.6107 Transcript_33757/m.6107 type:complete len:180 (+) Transcript_33757:886-1425(+)